MGHELSHELCDNKCSTYNVRKKVLAFSLKYSMMAFFLQRCHKKSQLETVLQNRLFSNHFHISNKMQELTYKTEQQNMSVEQSLGSCREK